MMGITISAIGSIGGFVFNQSFIMVVIWRAIQMVGGTCSSALLILTATKYLDEQTRMKYYGFNTACFSGGQLLGILLGGLFASYIGWKTLFIIPILSLVSIPFIIKYLPEDSQESGKKVDILGIMMMASLSLFVSLYFNELRIQYLLISAIIAIIFLIYISINKNAFISIDFFKNWKYMMVILVVLITYVTQGSYSFLFSFMTKDIYGIGVKAISMMLLPSYIVSMCIGIMGGKITKKLGIAKTLVFSLGSMALGLVLGSLFLEFNIAILVIMSCLFNGGFSILYTPIMTLVINSLPENMRGSGLGFFNLCIKITSSIGIVITGRLLMMEGLKNESLIKGISDVGTVYSNVLLVFLAIVIISFITINITKKFLLKEND
ncbi:TPA: MFS transporter [Clostridioides difficile]